MPSRKCHTCLTSLCCICAGSEADEEQLRPRGAPDSPPASTSGRSSHPPSPPPEPNHKHEDDVLTVTGQGFHVAHTVLLLLRMLQTYMTFQQAVPLLAADTARRAVELLKVSPLTMCPAANNCHMHVSSFHMHGSSFHLHGGLLQVSQCAKTSRW